MGGWGGVGGVWNPCPPSGSAHDQTASLCLNNRVYSKSWKSQEFFQLSLSGKPLKNLLAYF